jgi:hypothetical protein
MFDSCFSQSIFPTLKSFHRLDRRLVCPVFCRNCWLDHGFFGFQRFTCAGGPVRLTNWWRYWFRFFLVQPSVRSGFLNYGREGIFFNDFCEEQATEQDGEPTLEWLFGYIYWEIIFLTSEGWFRHISLPSYDRWYGHIVFPCYFSSFLSFWDIVATMINLCFYRCEGVN